MPSITSFMSHSKAWVLTFLASPKGPRNKLLNERDGRVLPPICPYESALQTVSQSPVCKAGIPQTRWGVLRVPLCSLTCFVPPCAMSTLPTVLISVIAEVTRVRRCRGT